MGERLLCKQEVIGSIPFTSTIRRLEKIKRHRPGQPGRGCCLKGEERVCHVTEADTPGANALDVSEEVSSCEAACADFVHWGVLPLCAAVLCGGTP